MSKKTMRIFLSVAECKFDKNNNMIMTGQWLGHRIVITDRKLEVK